MMRKRLSQITSFLIAARLVAVTAGNTMAEGSPPGSHLATVSPQSMGISDQSFGGDPLKL